MVGHPEMSLGGWLRRRLRAVERYDGIQLWLIKRGVPLGVFLLLVYVVGGCTLGWTTAYEVAVAITSPGDTRLPSTPAARTVAWMLALAGWLLTPGIAGAVVGYLLTAYADRRRTRPLGDFLPPRLPDSGSDGGPA